MARRPRIDLPGIPQHVVPRGNNRLPFFLDDKDRLHYLSLLRGALLSTQCRLHAYVSMDNHVHLLLTPSDCGAISGLMQLLGRRYVGQFNARHGRTGTLWEGRYKACLVDSERYVLGCARYLDLNPLSVVELRRTLWPPRRSAALTALRAGGAWHHLSGSSSGLSPATERSNLRGGTLGDPCIPTATARLGARRFPRDGRGQDQALCRRQAGSFDSDW